MIIAIAQINTAAADFSANRKKIIDFVNRAKKNNAGLVFFPALSLSGSPLFDLAKEKRFIDCQKENLDSLVKELPPDTAVGLGYTTEKSTNVYGVILGGGVVFELDLDAGPREKKDVFEYRGERVAIAGSFAAPAPDASLLCAPSALRFETGKSKTREAEAERISAESNTPLLFVNAAGANDSFIYGGRSFAVSPAAGITAKAAAFEEDLLVLELPKRNTKPSAAAAPKNEACPNTRLSADDLDELEEALVLGIRDYMKKSGFTRAHLGLSGGIDSALVAYLGVKAAGPANFTCIGMPSRFSSEGSKDDAKELAKNLGCRYELLPIEPIFASCLAGLEDLFEKRPFDLAEENLQSRIRGTLLMAFSNKWNSMLLTNGNKSELAMGYCTLYGDTNGALGPIGDIFKTEVFALARRVNERAEKSGGGAIIPRAIIDKPPSAELRPDQKDADSLPPYEVLDGILRLYIHENMPPEEIIKNGFEKETVFRVIRATVKNEFKRRQCPPALAVSKRQLGAPGSAPINRAVYELNQSQSG